MTFQLKYQVEQDIIDLAAGVDNSKVGFYPQESETSHRFLSALQTRGFVQRERPDFEDCAASLLLEAMRVDDHAGTGKKDKTRSRESELLREINGALGFLPDMRLFVNADSGLLTEQDHNYSAYVKHFTNTVLKHARNTDAYRAERPGYDLGFIIFDESTAYFEVFDDRGLVKGGRPHVWFADSAFAEVIAASDVDCLIWLTPYKRLLLTDGEAVSLPEMTVIDVELFRQEKTFEFDANRLISSEA